MTDSGESVPKTPRLRNSDPRKRLVRSLSHEVKVDGALFDIDQVFDVVRLWCTFGIFGCDNLNLDAIDTSAQLCLKHRLTLLLAVLIAWTWTTAVNTSRDRDAIHFQGLVAVNGDEEPVFATGQSNRDLWSDLQIRVHRCDHQGDTMLRLLLVGEDIDRPWFGHIKRGVGIERYLRYQCLSMTYSS
jgi:hypothetical protein